MKANFKLLLQTGYFVGLLILVLVGITAYQNFNWAIRKSEATAHAHELIHISEKLLSLIKETEADQWEYLFSSDSASLQPYHSNIHLINVYLNKLDSIAQDNAELKSQLLALKEATFSQIDLMRYAIELKSSAKETAIKKQVVNRQSVSDIEQLLTGIITKQSNLAAQQSKEYRKFLFRTRSFILCIIGSYFMIALVSFVLIKRKARKDEGFSRQLGQLRAEVNQREEEIQSRTEELVANHEELNTIYQQLEKLKNEFASIVMARTAKIKRANNRLLAEVIKRKRIGEALRKSEERFRIALDNAPIIVFNQDTQLRYTWMHHNASSIIRNEIVIGKTDFDVFSPKDAEHMTTIKKHVLETRQGTSQEVQVSLNRQRYHYLLTIEPLFNETNAVIGITCAAYDITQQKQAEDMLRETLKELKRRNHELDNYVYKVSHDLRAPLVSILGLINLTKMENDASNFKNYVSLIENRVNKLDDFIKSVLNHSRTLNSEIRITRIDFEKVIADCVEELHYLPNLDKINISVNVNKETEFFSDELRISIILKNFISNAVKYLNPFADRSYLRFDVDIDEQQAKIVIEDNGAGIEEQYLSRIFEMFFRGTSRSDGSGLGLYIVKQTIERLDGSVTVESEVGTGTKFRILLANFGT